MFSTVLGIGKTDIYYSFFYFQPIPIMKTLKIFASLLVVALMLTACQGEDPLQIADPASDNPEMTYKKKKAVPFEANFISTVVAAGPNAARCGGVPPADPYIGLDQTGSGNATHMGKITTLLTSCVELPTLSTFNVVLEITAANGDVLRIEDDPNGTDNDFLFKGGTGRFANASGTCVGTYIPLNGNPPAVPPTIFDTHFEGDIIY